MRLAQKGIRTQAAKSVNLLPSERNPASLEDRTEGYYKEEVKKLQERIRKSEIEKAELDLKITQTENKEYLSAKDSDYVTKLLYKENRELKKQIKGLQEELSLFRIERGKLKLNEAKSSLSPEKCRNTNEGLYKEKYAQLKTVMNRQKVKNFKKIATLKLWNSIKNLVHQRKSCLFKIKFTRPHQNLGKIVDGKFKKIQRKALKKIFETWKLSLINKKRSLNKIVSQIKRKALHQSINTWKSKNTNKKFSIFCNRLKKAMLYYHKAGELCKSFSKLKDHTHQSKSAEYTKNLSNLKLQLSKNHEKKTEIKSLQHQLITVIFIKNLRRVLLNNFRVITSSLSKHSKSILARSKLLRSLIINKQKLQILTRFNYWKHCMYDLTISDLCKLHEEQKVEKEYLIEQFDIIRMEDSQLISSKFRASALKKFNSSQVSAQRCLNKKYFKHWNWVTRTYKGKLKDFQYFLRRLEWIAHKRMSSVLYLITCIREQKESGNQIRIVEKIVKKNVARVRKVFNILVFNRYKKKLMQKYLEKLAKQRNFKAKLSFFRRFYQNSKLGLLRIMREESLLMSQNNKFLEQSLNTANSVIQDSSQILSAFEKRMQNKSLRLALGFSIENSRDKQKKCFETWKKLLNHFQALRKSFRKIESLLKSEKLNKQKHFYIWRIFNEPGTKSRNSSTILKIMNYKVKTALSESFNNWKVFKGYSELYEAIEHEKFNNLLCRITNLLLKCKKIKVQSTFGLWWQKVRNFHGKKQVLNKFLRLLMRKTIKQLKKPYLLVVNYASIPIPNSILKKLLRILVNNNKLQFFSAFWQFKQKVYMKKESEYKKDCEILLKLADCSEKMIEEKEKNLNLETGRTNHYKFTLKKLIYNKKPGAVKKNCFEVWKKVYSTKKLSLKKYLKIFTRLLNRKFLNILKSKKNLISMSNLLAVESPNQHKIPQDSIEFDLSDPSILHFNYKKLTPNFSPQDKSLKGLKLLIVFKYKNLLTFTLSKWKTFMAFNNLKNCSELNSSSKEFTKAYLSLSLLINSYQKLSSSLEICFKLWKNVNGLTNYKKTNKKPDQEQLIKKLLHENMTMAYKLSSAKVASKNFVRITADLCQNDKENNPEGKFIG